MHRLLLASAVAVALAATGGTATAAPASLDEVELIPRDALFGNPERANVQMSPDGRYLSWVAPLEGTLNVWVAPANDPSAARAVTRDTARGIRSYFWSHLPDTLLYLRDTGGDEDFHLYAVDLRSGAARDLTPYGKTTARVVGVSRRHPGTVLVGMNDRDPQWHDLYRVDLASGERTLVEENTGQIGEYVADADYQLRFATRSRPDGGLDLLRRTGDGWEKYDEVPFEDGLSTGYAGLTDDGSTLYLRESRGRNTSALFAIDTATGERRLVHEDARADIGGGLADPATGEVQAVSVNYLREEWTVLDDAIRADLERIAAIGPGEASINTRTLDDRTWIVAYSAAESPVEYYRYDRDGHGNGELTHLFSGRPALAGKPLVPMWPLELESRDGKTLVSYLTLPAHADADGDGKADSPVPLVLLVHGGPWARDAYGYSGWQQWLANRGYAVLSVNYRGSTGFGKDFTNAGDGEWAAGMHDDLIDAVQWAVESGTTTADKVAIMGGSYGGYATLVGLTFTPDTFACGVDIVGPANLNTLLSTVPPYWASFYKQIVRRMGDPETEEGRAWLTERSPLTRVDAIRKPLLIGQGANDPRVKQDESDQIVNAMTAKGIPVTYVLFPDEGHGFARAENSKAFNAVAEGFLAQCLGGRAQPIGDDFKGSSITVPTGADGVPGLAEALRSHTRDVRQ
ncbi:dipeptidyl aminopeptidase/acylaminoacyl peptidase [Luteimonas sp. J16]|uniref:S9 family peptidase n=1 Tax=unclassified Luteimonas TaxID=2629088 RepID=UPI0004797D1E|nr:MULTISPECIES: S9 family peptidase [unclassified Luteimonas]TWG85892.1 dipeptidyl aminopeptidase/acylaminoacyl peptidase [Luteimonas sp. J16]